MVKNLAKAEGLLRDLKDQLEFRGFSVAEERNNDGYPRLVIDTDQASIEVEQAEHTSKDIFGNGLKAYAPHFIRYAIDENVSVANQSKLMIEIAKLGIDKMLVKSAADLATAEAITDANAEQIIFEFRWPTKGV